MVSDGNICAMHFVKALMQLGGFATQGLCKTSTGRQHLMSEIYIFVTELKKISSLHMHDQQQKNRL